MKRIVTLFVFVSILFATLSAYAIDGETQGGFFYPAEQSWKIESVIHVDRSKTPADLRGIPMIIRGRDVYLTREYIAIPDINSGGYMTLAACFSRNHEGVALEMPGKFARPFGKTLRLRMQGRHLIMPAGRHYEFKLTRMPLPADFSHIRRSFDAVYNNNLDEYTRREARCRLEKIVQGNLINRDLVIVQKETGSEIVMPGNIMDPNTLLQYIPNRPPRKIDLSNKNMKFDDCMVKRKDVDYTRDKSNHGSSLIVEKYLGILSSTRQQCTRIAMIKRIDSAPILDLYAINYKTYQGLLMPPPRALSFEDWEDDDTFIAYYLSTVINVKYRFRFSNIRSDKIVVERLGADK